MSQTNQTNLADFENHFTTVLVPENRDPEVKTVLSPSGRFHVTVTTYRANESGWRYSLLEIRRTEGKGDGKNEKSVTENPVVYRIPRSIGPNYAFFTRGHHEWIVSGRSYMRQMFINLDTGETLDNLTNDNVRTENFCWYVNFTRISPDLICVDGCWWAGPLECKCYDFTHPEQGWPELIWENKRWTPLRREKMMGI